MSNDAPRPALRAGDLIPGHQLITLNLGGDGYESGASLLGVFLAPNEHSDVHLLSAQFEAKAGINPHQSSRRDVLRRSQFGDNRTPATMLTADDHWRQQARKKLMAGGRRAEELTNNQISAQAAELRAQGRQLVARLSLWINEHYGMETSSVAQLFVAWLIRDFGWRSVQSHVWTVSRYTTDHALRPVHGPSQQQNDPWPWRRAGLSDHAQQAFWGPEIVAADLQLSTETLGELWTALGWNPERIAAGQIKALELAIFRLGRPYTHMPVIAGTELDDATLAALRESDAAPESLKFKAKLSIIGALGRAGLQAVRTQIEADQQENREPNMSEAERDSIERTIELGWLPDDE